MLIPRRIASRPDQPKALGRAGERCAARHLRRRRYRILARNLRTRLGELDLIALAPDRTTLVFIEVKTKARDADSSSPPPEAHITPAKQRKLIQLVERLAAQRRRQDRPLRIDVIAIDWPSHGEPIIRHYENAIRR